MTEHVHVEHEDRPWSVRIPDHPGRTESKWFRDAKAAAHKILATLPEAPFGPGPWQQHHGASLWTFDATGWFLVLGPIGIEWSMQFCCDLGRVDRLCRQVAARHYAGFPETINQLVALGYDSAASILGTPITTPALLARWVDSIFNSCVPLAAAVHTGVIPAGAGAHHYPRPVADGQFVKRDDFVLFVTDKATGDMVAVTPVAPRGSGDGRVQVVYAPPTSVHHRAQHEAEAAGKPYVLPAAHDLAQQAFAKQS